MAEAQSEGKEILDGDWIGLQLREMHQKKSSVNTRKGDTFD